MFEWGVEMKLLSCKTIIAFVTFGLGVVLTMLWGVMRYTPLDDFMSLSQVDSWEITVTTGGGTTGRGEGNWVISSDRKVDVEPLRSGREAYRCCTSKLSVEELRQLGQVVSSASPLWWRSHYVDSRWPYGYADGIGTFIELRKVMADGREKIYTTTWSDSAEHLLPDDLVGMHRAARTVNFRIVNDGCRN